MPLSANILLICKSDQKLKTSSDKPKGLWFLELTQLRQRLEKIKPKETYKDLTDITDLPEVILGLTDEYAGGDIRKQIISKMSENRVCLKQG